MAKLGALLLWLLAGMLGLCILVVLFLAVCALLVRKDRTYTADSPFYRFLLDGATAFTVKLLGIHVHANGLAHLPPEGRYLLVGNHRSNFDPILTWYALKEENLAFISKPENFRIPIFGRIIRKCCFLPIDRENPRNAVKTIQAAAELLEKGEVSVGVYPEGTRSKEGKLLPFHNGVFKIAKKAGTPIVVVAIQGTEQIHKNVFRRRSDVQLTVAQVIPAEQVAQSRPVEIGDQVKSALQLALAEQEETENGEL